MIRLWLVVALASSAIVTLPPTVAAQQPPPPQETAPAPAPASDQSGADRLREEQRAYMGRNVRVHRTDGTVTTGRLIGETAEGLAVQPSPSDEPVLVPYDEVESIAVGMRRWQKIALAAGAAGAVLLAVATN
jgi:hypothetical protein